MATLRLVPVSGKPIEVTRSPSTVGREPSCDIVVTDGSVSRKHAQLEERSGIWHVVDQGSANGTYVNSLRVAETALKSGQELRFGALAFRVDLSEDPEATVASPMLSSDADTVMAPARSAPTPPPPPSGSPPPVPRAASAPPPPPGPPGAPDRFRPAGGSPVPPMAGGTSPPVKGKKPWFWIALGCCGCLVLAGVLAALGVGGVWFMTKGAADDAHEWITAVRARGMDAAKAGLSHEYASRVEEADLERIVAAIQNSSDATFPGRQVHNDQAVLTGVLTGSGRPEPIVIRLVKEGAGWKVDDVRLDDGFGAE